MKGRGFEWFAETSTFSWGRSNRYPIAGIGSQPVDLKELLATSLNLHRFKDTLSCPICPEPCASREEG